MQWIIRMTLDCVIPTQSSVMQTFTVMLVWSVFFHFYQNVCLLLLLYIHISLIFHKVVQRCIYVVVQYVIITLLQVVRRVCQWKKFKNRSIIGKDIDKSKVPRFLWPTVYTITYATRECRCSNCEVQRFSRLDSFTDNISKLVSDASNNLPLTLLYHLCTRLATSVHNQIITGTRSALIHTE